MAYRRRTAVRKTQAQVQAAKAAQVDVETAERSALQELAKERGIDARQSTDALREQLR